MRFDEARVDNMRRHSGAPRSGEPGIQLVRSLRPRALPHITVIARLDRAIQ
jgi:hypothetical protein